MHYFLEMQITQTITTFHLLTPHLTCFSCIIDFSNVFFGKIQAHRCSNPPIGPQVTLMPRRKVLARALCAFTFGGRFRWQVFSHQTHHPEQIFEHVHPETLEKMIKFDEHSLKMGGFNHQLAMLLAKRMHLLSQILLMVQKSGLHQLRLAVYPIFYRVSDIPGGCLGFLNHQQQVQGFLGWTTTLSYGKWLDSQASLHIFTISTPPELMICFVPLKKVMDGREKFPFNDVPDVTYSMFWSIHIVHHEKFNQYNVLCTPNYM